MSGLDAILGNLARRVVNDPNPPQNAGEEAFRQFMRREISARDYMIMTAATTAAAMHQYPVRAYTEPSALVARYINERGEGRREFDPTLGQAMGLWLYFVRSQLEQNQADQSYLRWAEEKLREGGLVTQAETCAARAKLFEAHPEPRLYRVGLRVQGLDGRSAGPPISPVRKAS